MDVSAPGGRSKVGYVLGNLRMTGPCSPLIVASVISSAQGSSYRARSASLANGILPAQAGRATASRVEDLYPWSSLSRRASTSVHQHLGRQFVREGNASGGLAQNGSGGKEKL